MIIEKNNIKVPDFLNVDYFQAVLEEGLSSKDPNLLAINFEMGSEDGNNYSSNIYRVILTYQQSDSSQKESLSVIVKTTAFNEHTKFLEALGVYVVEKTVYQNIIPRMELLTKNTHFGAKIYYAQRRPVFTIAFEDLKPRGYTTVVRQDLLDREHSTMIMDHLGKFHAASMVLAQKDPSVLNKFRGGMLSPINLVGFDTYKIMFGAQLMCIIKLARTWPGYDHIAEKLEKYKDKFIKDLVVAGARRPTDILVLNHGDLWMTNFMFKYNAQSQRPIASLLVDFQVSFYGSLGYDINYFLNTCVRLDVLKQHRENLIETYYDSFRQTLEECQAEKIPTLDDVRKQIRSREGVGFFGLYALLPLVVMDEETSKRSTIDSLCKDESSAELLEGMLKNVKFIELLKYGLKRFDDLGVLDEDYIEQ